jgi:nitronate monooxygenase
MRLEQALGVRLPIIQAPMAGFQDSALAIAVAKTGALGSLPCASLAIETLRSELAALREATRQPVNLNFFCHTPPQPDPEREARWRALLLPYYEENGIDPHAIAAAAGRRPFSAEVADAIEPFKPAVVSFHFGLPAPPLLARVRSWGARILSSATTVAEARWLEAHGVDAIIAQGLEAGGHRGFFLSDDLTIQLGTMALLPQIVRAVSVPVIAAGGIADAAGVAGAMAMGASAVQVGTAYLLCPEARVSIAHRSALKEAEVQTALTNLFSGGAARGIVNRIMRDLGALSDAAPAFPLAAGAIAPLRAEAERRGSGEFSPLWCGQNATGCREIPAAELTAALARGLGR